MIWGQRSQDPHDISLGPESPNVWFEDETGAHVTNLSQNGKYQIATNVSNLGSGPTLTLCVEFLVWTSSDATSHYYELMSTVQGETLMPGQSRTFKSREWSPGPATGLKPGDVIIRAYDPWADHYTETGTKLFVNQDRHLAHRFYK